MVYNHGGEVIMNFKILIEWAIGIFVIYLAIEIIRKILGGSLAFESIVIGLLVGQVSYLYHIHSRISKIDAKLSEHIGWHKGRGDFK